MATTSLQGIIQLVLLVLIIILASKYHQLLLHNKELQKTCHEKRHHLNSHMSLTDNIHIADTDKQILTYVNGLEPSSSLLDTSVSAVEIYEGTNRVDVEISDENLFESDKSTLQITQNISPVNTDSVFASQSYHKASSKNSALHMFKQTLEATSVSELPRLSPTEINSSRYMLKSSVNDSNSTRQELKVEKNIYLENQESTFNNYHFLKNEEKAVIQMADETKSLGNSISEIHPTSTVYTQVKTNVKTDYANNELKNSLPSYKENDFCKHPLNEKDSSCTDKTTDIYQERGVEDSNVQMTLFDQNKSDVNTFNDEESLLFESEVFNTQRHSEVLDKVDIKKLGAEGTSIRCNDDDGDGSLCYVQNLCYNTLEKDFVILKSNLTTIEVNSNIVKDGQLFLSLSAIHQHNAYMFRPVSIPGDAINQFTVSFIEKTIFLMSRFKPDNIMHIFHDDLFPLVHTLQKLKFQKEKTKYNIVLAFSDSYDEGDYSSLYASISSELPIYLMKTQFLSELVCFKNVYLGLSNKTLWYQYGFTMPQGPLFIDDINVGKSVRKASDIILGNLLSECMLCKYGNYIVLLSRKDNRLITNEGELILSIARSSKMKVMSVSLETHTIADLITIVRYSRGLIGMHGSLLSLASFLPSNSILIELFPYGVNPSKYRPYRKLSELYSYNLIYQAWTNPKKENSITHPDWPADLGGIHHLPPEVQKLIIDQKDVPDHLCCEDPSWLYHIYQDTVVDVEFISSLTASALNQSKKCSNKSNKTNDSWIKLGLPGPVKNLSCELTNSSGKGLFTISWMSPWNTNYLEYKILQYYLMFQQKNSDVVHEITLPSHILKYTLQHKGNHFVAEYRIWLQTVLDDERKSHPSYVTCDTPD